MNARVISIGDRRRDAVTAQRPVAAAAAPVAEPDIERVRRALANSFTVLKTLESDSEVERYLARDLRGGTVQLKVLSTHAAGHARARELFYLEAQAASKLAHMNILANTNAEHAHGVDFCVVEHKQDARTLGDLLDRNGWLDATQAAQIADQIASALDHAHMMGVLHLRLQPECVLVEPDGWVTIADFGVEANAGSERWKGPRVQYASPELTRRATVDHRSDLYSLGALLYEMLTDRTPFDSNDAAYVSRRQVSFRPSPPHLISPDVPEAVSNVVMKLLDREPAKRFASAAALQAALDDAISSSKN
ncbi:MAG: serine/threonine-protein kinase [Acidobacteriota bacterium]